MAGGIPADLLSTFLKSPCSRAARIRSRSSSARFGRIGFLVSYILLQRSERPG